MGGIVQHPCAIRQARIPRMPKAKRVVLADPTAAAALLDEYSKKRAFDATPQPSPAPAPGEGLLLFVVQKHSARQLHYDFRLECDGVLKSWAVPRGPSLNPADKRLAVMTEDHPYDYASFEGVIPPKQYGAGEVIVWDCGPYTPDEDRKGHWYHDRAQAERLVREGIAAGKLSVTLRGAKLKGSFALVRTARNPKDWLLIKHKDRFASESDVTERNHSVLSGLAVEDLKALPVRRMSASQLVPSGKKEALPVKLLPMLAELRDALYADRRRWLEQCVLPSPHVQVVHAEENGEELYKAALASGFEGVIAKRKDSKYEAGKRSQAWLKIKPTRSADFVVGGITKGKGSRAPLGALLLGYWDDGKLIYCGHVGSGFDDRTLAQVKARCEKLKTDTRPFADEPELHSPTTWIKPELVAEVEFQQWTPDGQLRAPVFLRLREDVDPKP